VDRLLKQDDALTAYGRALLALALHGLGREAEARRLVVNLENGVIRNDAADPGLAGTGPAGAPVPTAHWGRTDGWHRWSEGAVETTATAAVSSSISRTTCINSGSRRAVSSNALA
jgi:hypothetical protein